MLRDYEREYCTTISAFVKLAEPPRISNWSITIITEKCAVSAALGGYGRRENRTGSVLKN